MGDLYDLHAPGLRGYLRAIVRDDGVADDLTQEAFARLLSRGSNEPLDRETAWLYVVARNAALDRVRHARRTEPTDPVSLDARREAAPEHEAESATITARLDALRSKLPLTQRQALVLRYEHDFAISEIARLLDRSEDAVRHLEHRALSWLRGQLVVASTSIE